MENLRVLSGSVAVLNDIPARYLHPGDSPAQSRDYLLPGYFHDQYISLHLPENSLTTGTLFLGQPRCGKTNTIFLLADQVLNHMGPDDLAVFFDIKGDYQRAFYEEGDLVLDSLSSRYVWNIFDELLPYKNNSLLLKMRVRELCSYLYEESARDAGQNRFFVDGAQAVTECLFLCLLQSDTADSELNNANFLRLIGGAAPSDDTTDQALDHTYEEFLKVLNSDPDFYSARMYLPADPDARREGYGVLSEISRMVQRVFVGSFALAAHPERSISAESVAHRPGPTVLFLNYHPDYSRSQTYAFRFFVDSLIANRCRFHHGRGRTYFFLDELARLPKLLYLEPAMTLMRQANCCIVAGLQTVSQLYSVYGDREAQTILGAFQNLFVFNCDEPSQTFLQGRTRSALVQQRFVRADGRIDYTAPAPRRCIESWDFTGLQQGECFIQLADSSQPFRCRFTKNCIG